MSPNPHHDDQGRFTSPPEGAPERPSDEDPWAAVREAGITPEQAMRGGPLWRDLNDLDTREQAFKSIYRPEIDQAYLGQQSEEWESPFAQYGQPEQQQQEQEEYYEPPQPQVDLRAFAEDIYSRSREGVVTWADIERMQQEQVREQAFTDAAAAGVQAHNLPQGDAQFIAMQAKAIAAQQPNRPPADIAGELARARAAELAAWRGSSTPPLPGPAVPGGPVPSADYQPPRTEKEAMEASRMGLD